MVFAGRLAMLPTCATVLAALAACGGSDTPVGTAPPAVVACELLSVDEVEAALGVALRVDRETQPQDWICNWTEVERDVPAAQLLVTTSIYSTFEEFRDELESDLEVEVLPVDGLGEWAAWAGDSMLMAKDGRRYVQLTIFAESTLEVARPLVRLAIDRLPE